ncbi:MAG TPA: prepilin-type N-terminal cleavage/methylation domain-containing protein [Phycisphaerae bacterium]|nr:prepilin-type N-terminal cleavage/methylation domain-containing protein [Phycisphaerae bacterium]
MKKFSDKTTGVKPVAHATTMPCALSPVPYAARRSCAAFSLMEMLFAVFILAIGLIMVAGVFPVAIKWTADDAQNTVGAVIAQNALSTIQQQIQFYESVLGGTLTATQCYEQCYYGSASPGTYPYYANYYPNPAASPSPLPLWGTRSYSFGANQPDAATTLSTSGPYYYPQNSSGQTSLPLYYWTAYLQQISPGTNGLQAVSSASSLYRVYIFVFAKGDPNNVYPIQGSLATTGIPLSGGNPAYPIYQNSTALPSKPPSTNVWPTTPQVTIYPQIFSGVFNGTDSYNPANTGSVLAGSTLAPASSYPYPTMPIGSLGVDLTTGTVFRLIIGPTGSLATEPASPTTTSGLNATTRVNPSDDVLYVPPAVGSLSNPGVVSPQTDSPLIYIYTGTISF